MCIIDIHSACSYPSNVLSNFHANLFFFDGVRCGSIEGVLQSLRYSDFEEQKSICLLSGRKAKSMGKKKIIDQTLYWKGVSFNRHSDAYQAFLFNLYNSLFVQSENFRKALQDSIGCDLIHLIGKDDPFATLLTNHEFISNLKRLRKLL
ncbi:hypothetical protein VmeM32_00188 [Vibrio phage vB_VmeM-32]|nr:hypothetical protein VmeM32_00188 [Vibrio phage vB_VmeM-32]